MKIQLDQIGDQPMSFSEELTLVPARLERAELDALGTIRCEGQVLATDGEFVVTGRLLYRQSLLCHRCLGSTDEQVNETFELLVRVAGGHQESEPEIELEQSDLDVLLVEHEELDTEPLIVEQVQLNVPMKTLCSAECRGLCSICGGNLNHERCDCDSDVVDPRWSALVELREKLH